MAKCRRGHKRPGHWITDPIKQPGVWRCAACGAVVADDAKAVAIGKRWRVTGVWRQTTESED